MARGLNVFVNIGAKLLPSINSAASGVEKRFTAMNRRLRVQAAQTKLAMREMQAASSGLAGMAAAGGLTFGVSKAIGGGARLQHELQALRNAGRTTKEVSEAFDAARATAGALPTTTWSQNVELINETTSAFGDLHHAVENLSFNAKFGSMMANSLKIDQGEANHAIAQAVQALEIRGTAMDPAKYQQEMGELYKAMIFTKGQFNPAELKAFAQTGNIPLKMYSERFLTKVLPSLITEFGGGDTVGTMMTAFQNQIMGKVPLGGKKLTEEWLRLGLINKKDAQGHSNLSRTGWKPGAVVGHSLAMSDPLEWMEKIMLPALQRDGVDIDNDEQVITRMKAMFGRETGARMATTLTLAKQRMRLHKDEKLIGQATPINQAYEDTLKGDPMAGWSAIKSQMENLGAAIFGPGANGEASPVAVAMVNIAKGINVVAEAIRANPWLKNGIAALLLGGAALASLRLLGLGLGFILKPLGGVVSLWRLFFSAVGKAGPRVPWIIKIGQALKWLWGMVARLGPMLLGGLARLAPWVLRGILLLFTPAGLAVAIGLAVAAIIYYFRDDLMRMWNENVVPAFKNAWQAVVDYAKSIDWKSVGMVIANGLTFGLAGKLAGAISGGVSGTPSPTLGGPAPRGNGVPLQRALGGSVSKGVGYEWHERGREMFVPGRSGTVIPAHVVAAMNRGAANNNRPVQATFNIYDAHDPQKVAAVVDAKLRKLAHGQSALLSD